MGLSDKPSPPCWKRNITFTEYWQFLSTETTLLTQFIITAKTTALGIHKIVLDRFTHKDIKIVFIIKTASWLLLQPHERVVIHKPVTCLKTSTDDRF